MKNIKYILTLGIILIISVTVLTGCGDKDSKEETTTVDMSELLHNKDSDMRNLDYIEATLKTCITDYEMQYKMDGDEVDDILADGDSTGFTIQWDGEHNVSINQGPAPTGGISFSDIVNGAIEPKETTSKVDSFKHAKAEITKSATGLYHIEMSWN